MNQEQYKVWIDLDAKFYDVGAMMFDDNQTVVRFKESSLYRIDTKNTLHKVIKINDINVVVNGSILEFDDDVKSKAYVRYRNYAYEFYFFESGGWNKVCEYDFEKVSFKIVDTIQENNLGLIQENML